eukprot:TRINITY_DN109754_c0_g1_i1.p1 TRINITY_DN109754_c0_g1~~TRINITY_DN109754_c0_g1_i1.p1  ORF type:complete len:163 (-),score=21.12 TRINITY_DN109754_c0_g1_i1:78-566(-)
MPKGVLADRTNQRLASVTNVKRGQLQRTSVQNNSRTRGSGLRETTNQKPRTTNGKSAVKFKVSVTKPEDDPSYIDPEELTMNRIASKEDLRVFYEDCSNITDMAPIAPMEEPYDFKSSFTLSNLIPEKFEIDTVMPSMPESLMEPVETFEEMPIELNFDGFF